MRHTERCQYNAAAQRGFSLLEVLASIVVLSLIFAGFISVYGTVMRHGSDAELHSQAITIASAYMDEVLAQAYRDPESSVICGTPEANRPAFDNVCDYDGLPQNGCSTTSSACPSIGSCACDRSGTPVDGLTAFQVEVQVSPVSLNGTNGLQVSVEVDHDGLTGNGVTMQAFRTED
jgi:MSHA pilin protein MshD